MNKPQSLTSVSDLVGHADWIHWVLMPKKCPQGAKFPALCGTMTDGEVVAERTYRVCPDCERIRREGLR